MGAGPITGGRLASRLLGSDQPIDFLWVLGMPAAYVGLDLATRLLENIDVHRLEGPSLTVAAISTNPVAYLVAAVAVSAVVIVRRQQVFADWESLDQGRALRYLVLVLVVVLTWQGSLYEFNFLLAQGHVVDRVLLAVLAVGCAAKPIFVAPFALQSRIISGQFDYPFGSRAAQNIDDLLVIALLIVAAAHLIYVFAERRDTSPVLLLITAAVATHFFIPGISKMGINWLELNDLSNLPLSAYTAGWQGQGDGAWAARLSRVVSSAGRAVLWATLAVEIGAAVAVVHYQLTRIWLAAVLVFHVVLFAMTGFWFLSWLAIEGALLIILTRKGLASWVSKNATPARALLAVAAVAIAGGFLFHPPRLAWLDSPISYGYRMLAIGDSGAVYTVSPSALAPYVQELTFFNLRLGPDTPVSGGYGAKGSPGTYLELLAVETFDQLDDLEGEEDQIVRSNSQEFMRRFMDQANGQGRAPWSAVSPPDHFWTAAPAPQYEFGERIRRLDVYQLTSIHSSNTQQFQRTLVLTLVRGPDGAADIAYPFSG